MKQQGKTWIDHQKKEVQANRVTQLEKLSEVYGQRIAGEANAIFNRITAARASFLKMADEILQRSNVANTTDKKSIIFYTFDREYKFDYNSERKEVFVYRATKENPKKDDYEPIVLDMNPPMKLKSLVDKVTEDPRKYPLTPVEVTDTPIPTKELIDHIQQPSPDEIKRLRSTPAPGLFSVEEENSSQMEPQLQAPQIQDLPDGPSDDTEESQDIAQE